MTRLIVFVFLASLLLYTPSTLALVTLTGQGSSLAAPIYSSWAFDYQLERTDVQISYTASSSSGGLAAVKTQSNNFGASDSAITSATRTSYPDMIQFPTVAAAVVLAYNLPCLNASSGTLVLEREVIARIYLGEIQYWNDSALVNSQLDANARACLLASPQAIQVGAREEGSGTTGIFTGALCSFYPAWTAQFPCSFNAWIGSGSTANTTARTTDPNFHLIDQNFGVAGFVSYVSYSIGYVAYPTIAQENIFTLADMINKNGDRVTSNPPPLTAALTNATFDQYLVTGALTDSSAAGAWPIGGPTYVFLRTGTSNKDSCQTQRELMLFWKWTLTNSIAQLRLVFDGYASLGDAVHDKVLAKLGTITCPSTGASIIADQALTQNSGAGFIALLTVLEVVAAVVVTGVLVYLARDWRRIPAPAMIFFGALLLGAVLNYISLGWFYMVPKFLHICQLRKWFVALGFSCMFAAIFVRAFQIQNILLLSKSSKILASKARQIKSLLVLISTFAIIVGLQLILLIVWAAVDPWKPTRSGYDSLHGTYTYICSSKHNWIWFGLEIGFFASLLLFGLYVVYRSWDMKHLIIESKYLAVTVYNSLVIMIIVIILFATLASSDSLVFYVSVSAVGFLTSFSIIAFIGPKLLRLSDASSLATGTTGSNYELTRSKRTVASKEGSKGSKGSKDSYAKDSYGEVYKDSVREDH